MEYINFKVNFDYYLYVFHKQHSNILSTSKTVNNLGKKISNFIAVYKKNI